LSYDADEVRRQLVETVSRQASLIDTLSRTLEVMTKELASVKGKLQDRESENTLLLDPSIKKTSKSNASIA
jgi:uncharacterized membrane-anchored protein YhcB (DUF1043 family)